MKNSKLNVERIGRANHVEVVDWFGALGAFLAALIWASAGMVMTAIAIGLM